MANYCVYEMKIKGSKEAISRVLECLKYNYNYGEGKPQHKHFFRTWDTWEEEELIDNGNNTFTQFVYGGCAWSVYCCMCKGINTYYNDLKERYGKDYFMGTNLEEQSMDCEIEVFSEEEGMGFSEHFLFKNGKMLINTSADIETAGYDSNGNITTDIDWDFYDNETICLNPNRENNTGDFKWTI